MKHFIAYHNPEKMGCSLHESNALRVLTNKSTRRLAGNTVWFITRDETPERHYVLASVFRVTEVGDTSESRFGHYAAGEGSELQPPIPLDSEDWFPEFLRTTGHFGRGVPEITDQRIIDALKRFAGSAAASAGLT